MSGETHDERQLHLRAGAALRHLRIVSSSADDFLLRAAVDEVRRSPRVSRALAPFDRAIADGAALPEVLIG